MTKVKILEAEIAALKTRLEELDLIDELTDSECDEVTLFCPTPFKFQGDTSCIIDIDGLYSVTGRYKKFDGIPITIQGDTRLNCLRNAVKFKRKLEAKHG
jgi:hypothetical protein